jgi:hypothetical protein
VGKVQFASLNRYVTARVPIEFAASKMLKNSCFGVKHASFRRYPIVDRPAGGFFKSPPKAAIIVAAHNFMKPSPFWRLVVRLLLFRMRVS